MVQTFPHQAAASRTHNADSPRRGDESRRRVLHVVLDLEGGGLERVVADLIRTTDSERFELHLLAINFLGRYSAGLESYAALHVCPLQSRWSMLRPSSLIDLFRWIRPDIVHSHSGIWYKSALASRLARVPLHVHTDHGRPCPDPIREQLQDRLAARWTDRIVAVSSALARQLANFIVADPRKIAVIRNGIDTDQFRPTPDNGVLRGELGIRDSQPIIGSIGRLDRIKGYDVMIEAFAVLRSQWSDADAPVLVIAGDGPERTRLEALIRERGLSAHAHILGWRMDLQSLHAAMTVFTLASRSEGTSISLLEAMSAGLCPVVTRVGGTPEVLSSSLAHRLVPAETPDRLAAAWQDALCHHQRRAADGISARKRVEEGYSLDAMRRQYERLYTMPAISVQQSIRETAHAPEMLHADLLSRGAISPSVRHAR